MVNINNELFKYFIHFFEENAINYKKIFLIYKLKDLFPTNTIVLIDIYYKFKYES